MEPLDIDSDDYDSEVPEDDDEAPHETWPGSGQVTHLGPRTSRESEQKAQEAFLEQFDFHDYSSEVITRLAGDLLEFLVSTLEKDAISQFDHELITFNAIIAMDFHAKSFKSPGVISQAYSALIYLFQLVVVEAASQAAGTLISIPRIYIYILII
jgi:hypothetical protein